MKLPRNKRISEGMGSWGVAVAKESGENGFGEHRGNKWGCVMGVFLFHWVFDNGDSTRFQQRVNELISVRQ